MQSKKADSQKQKNYIYKKNHSSQNICQTKLAYALDAKHLLLKRH